MEWKFRLRLSFFPLFYDNVHPKMHNFLLKDNNFLYPPPPPHTHTKTFLSLFLRRVYVYLRKPVYLRFLVSYVKIHFKIKFSSCISAYFHLFNIHEFRKLAKYFYKNVLNSPGRKIGTVHYKFKFY